MLCIYSRTLHGCKTIVSYSLHTGTDISLRDMLPLGHFSSWKFCYSKILLKGHFASGTFQKWTFCPLTFGLLVILFHHIPPTPPNGNLTPEIFSSHGHAAAGTSPINVSPHRHFVRGHFVCRACRLVHGGRCYGNCLPYFYASCTSCPRDISLHMAECLVLATRLLRTTYCRETCLEAVLIGCLPA
jgi:hypothetical protein